MSRSRQPASERGFTLLEILMVVVILGILAAVAISQISTTTEDAKQTAFVSSLKSYGKSAEVFRFKTGTYLPDGGSGQVPAGFDPYIDENNWTSETPIGGVWDTENNDLGGVTSALGVHFNGVGDSRDDAFMAEVDALVDDGDLSTGGFRKLAATRYYLVLAE